MSSHENKEADNQLLVIGAGFGRTGTMSLQTAIEILYNKPCYHMAEVVRGGTPAIAKWDTLCDKFLDDSNAQFNIDDFKTIFKGYCGTVDHPSFGFVFKLMELYPKAKIILTVRDPQTWLASVRETVRPKGRNFSSNWLDQLTQRFFIGANFVEMVDKTYQVAVGKQVDLDNDMELVQAFEKWNDLVKATVPSDRLLVFQVKEGWQPLCDFLGLPVPEKPFPHVNERSKLKKIFEVMTTVKRITRITIYSALALGAAGLIYLVVKHSPWTDPSEMIDQ